MDVTVFVGPSLSIQDRPERRRIDYRGPAVCGDIALAVQSGARVIGLVDGRFETALPPWHKEILWAMGQGVTVLGAASMGALRAAELHRYGMVGVGEVFRAFAEGRLTDDDEVAVLHGPAELGYLAVTEPMVNVRWTLEAIVAREGMATDDAATIVSCAKALFYKERTWETVWAAVAAAGVPSERVTDLRRMVLQYRVDVKREDALKLLECALERASRSDISASTPIFVQTLFWQRMLCRLQRTAQ